MRSRRWNVLPGPVAVSKYGAGCQPWLSHCTLLLHSVQLGRGAVIGSTHRQRAAHGGRGEGTKTPPLEAMGALGPGTPSCRPLIQGGSTRPELQEQGDHHRASLHPFGVHGQSLCRGICPCDRDWDTPDRLFVCSANKPALS